MRLAWHVGLLAQTSPKRYPDFARLVEPPKARPRQSAADMEAIVRAVNKRMGGKDLTKGQG